jgi:hypothetical protein
MRTGNFSDLPVLMSGSEIAGIIYTVHNDKNKELNIYDEYMIHLKTITYNQQNESRASCHFGCINLALCYFNE